MADLVLVDNDGRIVELVAWFLRRAGHTVRTAESYAQARDLLRCRRPDLMLADLELGHERGDEELPRLATEGLLPPTLVVSGYLDRDLDALLRQVPGVRGTLGKPFDLALLERTVAECLAQDAGAQTWPGSAPPADEDGWIEIVAEAPSEPGDPGDGGGSQGQPDGGWVSLEWGQP
jgi:DNA-binding response OmpR family regulator